MTVEELDSRIDENASLVEKLISRIDETAMKNTPEPVVAFKATCPKYLPTTFWSTKFTRSRGKGFFIMFSQ